MAPAALKRRDACVMSLDVVGYSRMMARNDLSAVSALRDCRMVIEAETRRWTGAR